MYAICRHKKYIVPVLSLSIDFYVRVFVRVYTSAQVSKRSASKLAYVWQSQGCDSFYLQRVGQVRIATEFSPVGMIQQGLLPLNYCWQMLFIEQVKWRL